MDFACHEVAGQPVRELLTNLLSQIAKAEAHFASSPDAARSLMNEKLYPDMYSFQQQVQSVATLAMVITARLAKVAPPLAQIDSAKLELNLADLKAWLQTAVEFIDAVSPGDYDNLAEPTLGLALQGVPCTFTPKSFVLRFGLPNLYFHASMAYAILRHKGVPLGKSDFLLSDFGGEPTHFS